MNALSLCVALAVVTVGYIHRPRPSRPLTPRTPLTATSRSRGVGVIGASIARLFGHELRPGSRAARQLGAGVWAIPVGVLSPVAGAVVAVWAVGLPVFADRRDQQRREQRLLDELPEVIDLLAVAVAGGRTVPLAIDDVIGLVLGPVADSLAACRRRAGLGVRLADELDALPARHGELIRPLVRALVAAERYGTPIGPSLDAAAVDIRLRRRRTAERRARQLPVKMLFPLVICVLPAFALLTVVPVLIDAFSVIRP